MPKYFLLAQSISNALSERIAVSDSILKDFMVECSNKTYKSLVMQKIEESKIRNYPQGSSKLLFSDGKTVQDIQTILSKNKGKMMYIDFWASWCGACREEMSFSAKLRKEYAEKNIVFLYISIDTDIKDWQKANEEENLDKLNSFLMLNYETASFITSNNLQSIPRFMLIDKAGKIIDKDAPRPSESKLKVLIDKYLTN